MENRWASVRRGLAGAVVLAAVSVCGAASGERVSSAGRNTDLEAAVLDGARQSRLHNMMTEENRGAIVDACLGLLDDLDDEAAGTRLGVYELLVRAVKGWGHPCCVVRRDILDALLRASRDPDSSVRDLAARSLSLAAPEHYGLVRSPLVAMVSDSDRGVVYSAAASLVTIGVCSDQDVTALESVAMWTNAGVIRSCAEPGGSEFSWREPARRILELRASAVLATIPAVSASAWLDRAGTLDAEGRMAVVIALGSSALRGVSLSAAESDRLGDMAVACLADPALSGLRGRREIPRLVLAAISPFAQRTPLVRQRAAQVADTLEQLRAEPGVRGQLGDQWFDKSIRRLRETASTNLEAK